MTHAAGADPRVERGRSPPRRLLTKNWDARPIKSSFYQSQNAPKLAFLSSKIEKMGGTLPPQTPPLIGRGTPSLAPHPSRHLRRLDHRAYRSRHDSHLRCSLGAYTAPRPQPHLFAPLAIPSGSAVATPALFFVTYDLDLWPSDSQINGHRRLVVQHWRVNFCYPIWVGFWGIVCKTDRQTKAGENTTPVTLVGVAKYVEFLFSKITNNQSR